MNPLDWTIRGFGSAAEPFSCPELAAAAAPDVPGWQEFNNFSGSASDSEEDLKRKNEKFASFFG